MTTAAIIVAAGRGTRAGPGAPKQWRPLAGRRVIDWTVEAYLAAPDIGPVMVVLHPDDLAGYVAPVGVQCCTGGTTRTASISRSRRRRF